MRQISEVNKKVKMRYLQWVRTCWGVVLLSFLATVCAHAERLELDGQWAKREDIVNILQSRSRRCPLVREIESFEMVVRRLRDNLKVFECKEQGGEALEMVKNELATLAADPSSSSSSSSANISGSVTTENAQLLYRMDRLVHVFDGLLEIGRSDKCRNDLQGRRGFLDGLADTILSLTQWGALGGGGLKIVMGGSLVYTLIHLVNRFFTRDYDWRDDRDRALFDKLNCTFHDIRFDLDQMGIFGLDSEQTHSQELQLRARVRELKGEQELLEQVVEELKNGIESGRQAFFRERISLEEEEFNEHAGQLLEVLGRPGGELPSTPPLMLVVRIPDILEVISEIPWPSGIAEYLVPEVERVLEDFSIERYLTSIGQEEFSLQMELLRRLLSDYPQLYQQKLALVEGEWQSSQLRPTNASIAEKEKRLGKCPKSFRSKSGASKF